MKINDQVSTIWQGSCLAKFGIKSEGHFWHYQEKTPTNPNMALYGYKQENMPWSISLTGRPGRLSGNQNSMFKEYPAFTVAELGVMLPNSTIRIDGKDYIINTYKIGNIAYCEMRRPGHNEIINEHTGATEAEARADMLIFGIRRKLPGFTIEEINNRLNPELCKDKN